MMRRAFDDKSPADSLDHNPGPRFYPELMCRAEGCPNRWSVNAEGRHNLCSAHAWSSPHLWPMVTQEQRNFVASKGGKR